LNVGQNKMKTHVIESLGQYVDLIQSEFAYGHLYRGVGDEANHRLIPSLGRCLEKFESEGKNKDDLLKEEANAFRVFCLEGRSSIDHEPASEWEWLAIAQHHGLPTRLMDWTFSSSVALFFSLWSQIEADAAVYVMDRAVKCMSVNQTKKESPFSYSNFASYLPAHVSPRIRAQSGVFTLHPDPTLPPPEKLLLAKIIIPQEVRRSTLHGLNLSGFNRKVLFPDTDGLAQWLAWMKFK
jgi:hypothetical protein